MSRAPPRRRRLRVAQVVARGHDGPVVIAVCEALHYAYYSPDEQGQPRHVIHRDVSPSNVLVGYDGHVKLADFGVTELVRECLPDDQVAFGGVGSDSFSRYRNTPPRRQTITSDYSSPDSFASVEISREPRAEAPAEAPRSHRGVVITTLVMAVLTAVFWTLVVPYLS